MNDVPPQNTALYDPIAAWYDREVSAGNIVQTIAHQTLEGLLEPVLGLRVVDAACGQGVIARLLAGKGAQVTGMDVSSQLIALAKGYVSSDANGPDYVCTDLCDPEAIASFENRFDAATCNMALTDVEDLGAFLQSIKRIIKPGGWAVFTFLHPCFHPTSVSWHVDADGAKGRVIYDYFGEGRWHSKNQAGMRHYTGAHHRTLATYLNSFIAAGFELQKAAEVPFLDEKPPDDPPYEKIPAVFGLRVGKPVSLCHNGKASLKSETHIR